MTSSAMRTLLTITALTATLHAQQPTSALGTGTVTGHVTCGDTQGPGRFASVVLYGVPAEVTPYAKPSMDGDKEAAMLAMANALESIGKTNMVQSQTGVDGNFVATDVAPGDYYVFAALAGYVTPLSQVQALFAAGADVKKPLPGVQVVHVTADHTASISTTMERGAAISGSVLWDDGSPVSGAVMAILPAKGDNKPPQQFNMLAMASILSQLSVTDDQGRFRLSSLPAGDYIVTALLRVGQQTNLGAMNLSKMMSVTPLTIYAPAAFHKSDAKAVTVKAGEDYRDEAMTLKLGGLHTVSGRITSTADGHGLNQATITLQDQQDKEFKRSAGVDAAGNYTVTFVPAGSYQMKVSDAEDTEPKKKTAKDKSSMFSQETTLRSYVDGKLNVVVSDSDLTGQNVDLAIEKNPKKTPDFSKLFGGDDEEKPAK